MDDTTELSRLLSELISNDDVLSLSFCLRNLFECVNMNNEKLFHRIFKTIKFKEKFENFKFNDNRKNYLQIFANVPSVDQINIVKNGKLSSLYEKGKSK